MARNTLILIVLFLTFNVSVNGQSNPVAEPVNPTEKARYLKEDLAYLLAATIQYPARAIQQEIQGDVVFSFVITKEGELDSLSLDSSPDNSLSTSAMEMMDKIETNAWSPAKINNQPIDKRYVIIFRYRKLLNSQPIDYKGKAASSFAKQKYKTALKQYTDALKDNPFDQELFEGRSKVKEAMGDLEGAQLDHLASLELQDEVMTVVGVTAFGITRQIQMNQRVSGLPGQHSRQRF